MWEDPSNRMGGKFVMRVRKGLAARYWEEILMAVVGEQFGVGDEICGIVLSLRFQDDIISIWNKNASNREAHDKIRDTLQRLLGLPLNGLGDYNPHRPPITNKVPFRS